MHKTILTDGFKITGKSILRSWDIISKSYIPEDYRVSKNLIISYEDIADVLIGNSQIAYCGVGSGTTPATTTDTALEAQIGNRKPVTTATRDGAVCCFSTFFSGAENNGTWGESCLSLTLTGTILNRALYYPAFIKNSSKNTQNDWLITVQEI